MTGLGSSIARQAEARGEARGEHKLIKLLQILIDKGNQDEMKLALSDDTARKEMYKKYNIID